VPVEVGLRPYYGYDKDQELACGAYKYHRNTFKSAQQELEDALRNVALFCGPCDQDFQATRQTAQKETVALKKEIASLESRIKKLEAENAALRRAARVPGSK
jgi:SMC interacting uncharacterized protein involved in chromosome segregation